MISLTGGFNQQFVAGAPKIHKLKYATDTLALSDAIAAGLTVQHFRDNYADTMTLTDAIVPSIAYVPDIEHGYSDALVLSDAIETNLVFAE